MLQDWEYFNFQALRFNSLCFSSASINRVLFASCVKKARNGSKRERIPTNSFWGAFDRKPLMFSESLGLLIYDNFITLHAAFAEHKKLKVYKI